MTPVWIFIFTCKNWRVTGVCCHTLYALCFFSRCKWYICNSFFQSFFFSLPRADRMGCMKSTLNQGLSGGVDQKMGQRAVHSEQSRYVRDPTFNPKVNTVSSKTWVDLTLNLKCGWVLTATKSLDNKKSNHKWKACYCFHSIKNWLIIVIWFFRHYCIVWRTEWFSFLYILHQRYDLSFCFWKKLLNVSCLIEFPICKRWHLLQGNDKSLCKNLYVNNVCLKIMEVMMIEWHSVTLILFPFAE